MATWLLLEDRFPIQLPKVRARVDAPDIETAHKRLGLLSGLGASNIARGPKEARLEEKRYWVQSEASAMLGPEKTKKAPGARRRFTR